MPEPWKHEPLTVTPEQRVAALRAIASARTHTRNIGGQEHAPAAIDRRLLALQRFLEGKRPIV